MAESGRHGKSGQWDLSISSGSSVYPRQTATQENQGCLHSFFALIGPHRPFFGSHTIAEAGGSLFLPTSVILVFRLLCTCVFVFTTVLFSATGDFEFAQYGVWVYIGAGISMTFATFSSLGFLLHPDVAPMKGFSHFFTLLAKVTVPTSQIFLTLAILASILFWSFLLAPGPTIPTILLYAGGAVVMLVDSLISARMNFRLSYVILGGLFSNLWLAFAWIRFAVIRSWMYNRLDSDDVGAAHVVLFHVTFLAGPLLLGIILLCANRILPVSFATSPMRHKPAENNILYVPSLEDLRVLAYADLYANLAAGTAKSRDFTSVSAPHPMCCSPDITSEQSRSQNRCSGESEQAIGYA